MDQILIPAAVKLHIVGEQQAESCCSNHFMTGYFGYGKSPMQLQPCIASGMTSHTFGAAPGERDQYFDRYNLVTSELGLYASQWRYQ